MKRVIVPTKTEILVLAEVVMRMDARNDKMAQLLELQEAEILKLQDIVGILKNGRNRANPGKN